MLIKVLLGVVLVLSFFLLPVLCDVGYYDWDAEKWKWHDKGLDFQQQAKDCLNSGNVDEAIEYCEMAIPCYEKAIELDGGDKNNPCGIGIEHNIVMVEGTLYSRHEFVTHEESYNNSSTKLDDVQINNGTIHSAAFFSSIVYPCWFFGLPILALLTILFIAKRK